MMRQGKACLVDAASVIMCVCQPRQAEVKASLPMPRKGDDSK